MSNKALFFFMVVYFLLWRNIFDIVEEVVTFSGRYPFFSFLFAFAIYFIYRVRKNKSDNPGS